MLSRLQLSRILSLLRIKFLSALSRESYEKYATSHFIDITAMIFAFFLFFIYFQLVAAYID